MISDETLDDCLAILGMRGSGKTYTAKGLVERLLDRKSRVCVVDPLGVWWGLRSNAAGDGPGYGIVVFGGLHADVEIGEASGEAVARVVALHDVSCIVDISEFRSMAARRRFMLAFCDALYDLNRELLHLILDEADLWAPQRPMPDTAALLGSMQEIVRRGRVRGLIPWQITQRPAVLNKDVLSQADTLIAMKLTASQDRDAIGAWIEGQADREDGKRILADLPKLRRGEGYVWAPSREQLERVAFPRISTFDSSSTPKRGERRLEPVNLASVEIAEIAATLALVEEKPSRGAKAVQSAPDPKLIEAAEQRGFDRGILQGYADALAEARSGVLHALDFLGAGLGHNAHPLPAPTAATGNVSVAPSLRAAPAPRAQARPVDGSLNSAARKLLTALAQHAPARFTWGQTATLAGLKPSGGHFNAGRKQLIDRALIDEADGLVSASSAGMTEAGEVPAAPSSAAERLAMWCGRLPSPAPDMLRYIAARGSRHVSIDELAEGIGKKATGGHWNSGIAVLRNNGLIEVGANKTMRASELLR